MLTTGKLRAVIFLGAFLQVCGVCYESGEAQPASDMAAKASQSPAADLLKEIHVDDRCRILPDPASLPPGKRPHLKKNSVLCHLESVHDSTHVEEMIVGNEKRRSRVSILEQEYVLQDVTPVPLQFVVEAPVPAGWRVDSDPQPADFEGATALFRVRAQPGQIVRLHVGLRRDKPLRTQYLRPVVQASVSQTTP